MDTIEIYNVVKKIPEILEEQAREIADAIANKSKTATKEDLIALESRLENKTWRIVFTIVAIMNALLFAALKFAG